MGNQPKNSQGSGEAKGLTCIRQRIHCAATTDGVGGTDELDQIAINNFLETLVEVALAVAARKRTQGHGPDGGLKGCEP